MPKHLVYGLDIETDLDPVARTSPDAAAQAGEIHAVDPRWTRVTNVVVSTASQDIVFNGHEADLLLRLDDHLADLEPGILATWNGSGFDLPFLADRADANRIRLGLHLAADPRLKRRGEIIPGHRYAYRAAWHNHRHLDVARLYRSGRRPLIDVDELLFSLGWTGRTRPRHADSTCSSELAQDAAHAFATNDARLVRMLVETRLPGVIRNVDRISIPSTAEERRPMPFKAGVSNALLAGTRLSPAHPAVRAALLNKT